MTPLSPFVPPGVGPGLAMGKGAGLGGAGHMGRGHTPRGTSSLRSVMLLQSSEMDRRFVKVLMWGWNSCHTLHRGAQRGAPAEDEEVVVSVGGGGG